MADEARPDDGYESQRHKKLMIINWVFGTLLALCTFHLCYGTVHFLRFRARSRAWPPFTSLPKWRAGRQSETRNPVLTVIPLQEVTVRQAGPQEIPQHPEQCCAFLELPPEIRTHIYSYFLPGIEPTSTSRAFRRTCHQVNHEIEHEARKAFISKMISLQGLASGSHRFLTSFYSAETYHVEMVLQLPQLYFPPSLPPPIAQTRTVVDAVALTFVELLPLNTHSVTITIQPHLQGSPSNFERYFDGIWSTLWEHLERNSSDATKDITDLRHIIILTGSPVFMVPEVRFSGFSLMLSRFEMAGICLGYDTAFKCQLRPVLAGHLRCRMLLFKFLARSSHRLKMYVRYKEGSS